MRAVIDTNVFVSSFFGGKPRKIIDLWKDGKIMLCLSGAILDEYADVLHRIGVSYEGGLRELLTLFAKGYNTAFIAKTKKIHAVKADPADDKFVECAVELDAEAIITGDKELRSIRNYRGIKIYTPAEFLKEFNM